MPVVSGDLRAGRIMAAKAAVCSSATLTLVPREAVYADLAHAREWNALFARKSPYSNAVAIDRQFLGTSEALDYVFALADEIICAAKVVEIPSSLLAGVLAAALDFDYNAIDRFVDGAIAFGWGDPFTAFDVSAGYAQVHYLPLRRTLLSMGRAFFSSTIYEDFYDLIIDGDQANYLRSASRSTLVGILSGAVMVRHYTDLRLNGRSMATLTATDMALIWTAYRGGVSETAADPTRNYRWDVRHYRHADNPYLFADALLSRPYFVYFQAVMP
ncbi:MAG TPA: hypothetical protein PLD47_00945 [Aggregatilineales bacterium]|nr:hypothetical protein [Anaerolineales bacterium]HRE46265.1 hypothetical protein [Aggregatilineales bacterium]